MPADQIDGWIRLQALLKNTVKEMTQKVGSLTTGELCRIHHVVLEAETTGHGTGALSRLWEI